MQFTKTIFQQNVAKKMNGNSTTPVAKLKLLLKRCVLIVFNFMLGKKLTKSGLDGTDTVIWFANILLCKAKKFGLICVFILFNFAFVVNYAVQFN